MRDRKPKLGAVNQGDSMTALIVFLPAFKIHSFSCSLRPLKRRRVREVWHYSNGGQVRQAARVRSLAHGSEKGALRGERRAVGGNSLLLTTLKKRGKKHGGAGLIEAL